MTTASLNITGMSCGGCVARVTRALGAVPGLKILSVQVGSAVVSVPDDESLRAAVAAVSGAGFPAEASRSRDTPSESGADKSG